MTIQQCNTFWNSRLRQVMVDQEYVIVTFDLAVAKKAYALVWQYSDQFSKILIRIHTHDLFFIWNCRKRQWVFRDY